MPFCVDYYFHGCYDFESSSSLFCCLCLFAIIDTFSVIVMCSNIKGGMHTHTIRTVNTSKSKDYLWGHRIYSAPCINAFKWKIKPKTENEMKSHRCVIGIDRCIGIGRISIIFSHSPFPIAILPFLPFALLLFLWVVNAAPILISYLRCFLQKGFPHIVNIFANGNKNERQREAFKTPRVKKTYKARAQTKTHFRRNEMGK